MVYKLSRRKHVSMVLAKANVGTVSMEFTKKVEEQ